MTKRIEDKLGLLRYKIDAEHPHIQISKEICEECKHRPCIVGCPANCFKYEDEEMQFQYEDCIECGTCRVICPYGAVDWNYPRGTFGVKFRYG